MSYRNDRSDIYAYRVESRFGEEKTAELISAYQNAWWTDGDFDNVKAMGFNVIRLPFAYFNLHKKDLFPGFGLAEGAEESSGWDFSILDDFIAGAKKRGIYVILDLHGAYGSQNGKDHSGDTSQINLFGNQDNENKTVELWRQISLHYKNEPAVAGYDLLNEPEGEHGKTTAVQWDFYDRLIQTIRGNGDAHIVFAESVWEASDLPHPSVYGWENIIYEFHNYKWENRDNYYSQLTFVNYKITSYEEAAFGIPVFIGEFTCFNNSNSWKYTIEKYNEKGCHWTVWTYKVVGAGSSWGLYTADIARADIYNDSFDEIKQKWMSASTSESFIKNDTVISCLTVS